MRNNENITGLRGILALLIVFHHIYGGPLDNNWFTPPSHGWISFINFSFLSFRSSVDLFFAISGYLISGSLLNHRNVRDFLVNRFIRIYPVFIISVFTISVIGIISGYKIFSGNSLFDNLKIFFLNALILPGIFNIPSINEAAWSLSYEVLFYFLAIAFFIMWKPSKNFSKIFLIIFCGFVFFRYPRFGAFMSGFIAYQYRDVLRLNLSKFNGGFCVLGFFLLFFIVSECAYEADIRLNQYVLYIVSDVLCLIVFSMIESSTGKVSEVIRSRWIQYLGMISYSFYLWHLSVEFVGKKLVLHFIHVDIPIFVRLIALALFVLPISVIAAHFSYKWIEVGLARSLKSFFSPNRKRIPNGVV